jgi:hypothetical protein
MKAALGPVFVVDCQLIRDGTFFVVETGEEIVGCGGWSQTALSVRRRRREGWSRSGT